MNTIEPGMPGTRKHRTTMAAEGLPRLALTVDDVYKMVEAGILNEDDRVELIEGELVSRLPHPRIERDAQFSYLALSFSERLNASELLNSRFSAPSFRHGRRCASEDVAAKTRSGFIRTERSGQAAYREQLGETRRACMLRRRGGPRDCEIDPVAPLPHLAQSPA